MASYREQEEALLNRAMAGAALLFIDFEASSLNQKRSYPIEFGWQRVIGNALADGGSFLIRPAPAWEAPGAWSNEAACVHGISKEALLRDGIDPADAASRTRALIGDAVVVGDAPSYDRHWWRVLLDQLPDQPPPPVMVDLDELGARLVKQSGGTPDLLDLAREAAREARPPTHRAGDDAFRLAQRWIKLRERLRL